MSKDINLELIKKRNSERSAHRLITQLKGIFDYYVLSRWARLLTAISNPKSAAKDFLFE